MLQVSFLDSSTLLPELQKSFETAKSARIAVAFFGKKGYDVIAEPLENSLRNKRKVTFVVGISNYHTTDWQALDGLVKLKKRFNTLDVRYYNNEGFHPKLFAFKSRKESRVIIGSSNLTGAGLKSNVEANLLVTGKPDHETFAQIDLFWNNILREAQILDEDVVDKYKASFRKAASTRKRTEISLPKTPIPSTSQIPSVDGVRGLLGIGYWKIAPGKQGYQWPYWEKDHKSGDSYIAVGWDRIKSLNGLIRKPKNSFIQEVQKRVRRAKYSSSPSYAAGQFWRFCREMQPRDIVVAYSRKTIFGIGRVTGSYYYQTGRQSYAHRRKVKWVTFPKIIVPERMMRILATNNVVNAIRDFVVIQYIQGLMRDLSS